VGGKGGLDAGRERLTKKSKRYESENSENVLSSRKRYKVEFMGLGYKLKTLSQFSASSSYSTLI